MERSYAAVLGWIRCRLSFCLLRSAIQCIRGARSSQGHYVRSALWPWFNQKLIFQFFCACLLCLLVLIYNKKKSLYCSLLRLQHPLYKHHYTTHMAKHTKYGKAVIYAVNLFVRWTARMITHFQIWVSSNLCHLLLCEMYHYTHLYGLHEQLHISKYG